MPCYPEFCKEGYTCDVHRAPHDQKVAKENLRKKRVMHGMGDTYTYVSWIAMRYRCNSKRTDVAHYWQYRVRGIRVCKRWDNFVNFYKDMGERPKGHSIDRINNNKGYSPSNCRWATPLQQCQNLRTVHRVRLNGESMSISLAARLLGTSRWKLKKAKQRGVTEYVTA